VPHLINCSYRDSGLGVTHTKDTNWWTLLLASPVENTPRSRPPQANAEGSH
jgi:hypothetical protein